jgi:ribosome-associated translation inhibitor RaiA
MGSTQAAREVSVVIHFRGIENDDVVREHLTGRCQHLADEFPETTHFELTLEPDAEKVRAHGHVVGKGTHSAAHANGVTDVKAAGDALVEKLHKELRKLHDKRIFTQRRKEQKKRANHDV